MPKPKRHYLSALILILCLTVLGIALAEPGFFTSVKEDLQPFLKNLLERDQAEEAEKDIEIVDPEAAAACQEYIKEINAAIQHYAKDHPDKKYPWKDYSDLIDTVEPTLVPRYLNVIRGCPEEGKYTYDPEKHRISCSIAKHNP